MLPLLRDRAVFALCPDRVIAVRWHKGSIVSKVVLAVPGSMLSTLAGLLASEQFRNTDVTVILSNHFMHFAVMPWNGAFLSWEEELALAQHRFNETYGEGMSWEIRSNENQIGSPMLASAVAKDFLENIKQLFATSGVRLKSIQPYLMSAFNACRQKLPKEPAWFVLAEKGLFCIALLKNGQWHRIRQMKSDDLDKALLALEREALLSEENSGRNVYLYAPENREWSAKLPCGSWTITPIAMSPVPGMVDVEAANYAMVCA